MYQQFPTNNNDDDDGIVTNDSLTTTSTPRSSPTSSSSSSTNSSNSPPMPFYDIWNNNNNPSSPFLNHQQRQQRYQTIPHHWSRHHHHHREVVIPHHHRQQIAATTTSSSSAAQWINNDGRPILGSSSPSIFSDPVRNQCSSEDYYERYRPIFSPRQRQMPPPSRSYNVVENTSYPMRSPRECKFCKNNGETPDQYTSHTLRHPVSGVLVCNVLRGYVCPKCKATGDGAHTLNYCPEYKKDNLMGKLPIPMELKRTKRMSNGCIRRQ